MTLQEIDVELEKCEVQRLTLKQKALDLKKIRTALLEEEVLNKQLANMPEGQKALLLKKLTVQANAVEIPVAATN